MKKIITLLTMLALSLSAEMLVNVGANQITINDETGTGFNIGYGIQKTLSNDILIGIDFNYDQVEIETDTLNSFGADLKLGYKYRDFAVYAIGSGIYQSYFDNDAAGFGFGGGASYQPFEHFRIAMDYKFYSMTSEVNAYDFDTVKLYIQILF